MLEAFPYQERATKVGVQFVNQRKRLLLTSPTGTGKSLIEALIWRELTNLGYSALIVTPREEILEGIVNTGHNLGFDLSDHVWTKGKILPGIRSGRQPLPDVLLGDEWHHGSAPTYRELTDPTILRKQFGPKTKVPLLMGFTATPMRGLDEETPEWRSLFDQAYSAISLTQAIRQGYLVNFGIAMDGIGKLGEEILRGGMAAQNKETTTKISQKLPWIFDYCMEHGAGETPTVIAAPTMEASMALAIYFRSRGVSCEHVTGDVSSKERKIHFRDLALGRKIVVGVDILLEGFDVPPIALVVVLRNSVVATPYIQFLGRGLRMLRDGWSNPRLDLKPHCRVLDLTHNLEAFGPRLRDTLGLTFVERNGWLEPNLDAEEPEYGEVKLIEDYVGFDFHPRPASVLSIPPCRITTGIAHSAGVWAVEVDGSTYVLVGREFKKRPVVVTPKDYELRVGGRRDLALELGAKLARGVAPAPHTQMTLAQLLAFSWIHQEGITKMGLSPNERAKRASIDPSLQQKSMVLHMLKALPSPNLVEKLSRNVTKTTS